ncbi:hypothetical protein A9Q84_12045 [Halobacteriovorax marinus]|uniref:Fe2OG dioxygenase domain-containing protein n=1 Tax=Halobacteriovorax marinus TaxID=97084 RepID=A0A1Y5F807_9BACT|nr:hypothetical protein A9Q84_12045 [Halobacteriovorax marinus]
MNQKSLNFGEEELISFDGEVSYFSNFFEKDYFFELYNKIEWQEDEITIFGKTHPIPRLQAWYADDRLNYSYSGIILKHHHWTKILLEIKNKVESETGFKFNGCLINLYRDGRDYVSWHSDDEVELGEAPDIASVSFGETRTLSFRHRETKKVVKCQLDSGSLIVMKSPLQKFWEHQLNKSSKDIGARINLTFRYLQNT